MQAIVSLKSFEKIVVDLMLEKTRILFEVSGSKIIAFNFNFAHPLSPKLEAARRKRAMELSAVRKGRAKLFSLS